MRGDVLLDDAFSLEAAQTTLTERVRSVVVAAPVFGDHLFRRLQRPVRGRVRQVRKEGLVRVALVEVAEHAFGEVGRRVERFGNRAVVDKVAVFDVDGRQDLDNGRTVFEHRLVAVVISTAGEEAENLVETAGVREAVLCHAEVPFARHERVVAGVPHDLAQGSDALVEHALVARTTLKDLLARDRLCHLAETCEVVVGAGEEHLFRRTAERKVSALVTDCIACETHGTSGTACGRGVKRRKPYSFVRESIEVRRRNLSAKASNVREAEVIGEDDQEVGFLGQSRHLAGTMA